MRDEKVYLDSDNEPIDTNSQQYRETVALIRQYSFIDIVLAMADYASVQAQDVVVADKFDKSAIAEREMWVKTAVHCTNAANE